MLNYLYGLYIRIKYYFIFKKMKEGEFFEPLNGLDISYLKSYDPKECYFNFNIGQMLNVNTFFIKYLGRVFLIKIMGSGVFKTLYFGDTIDYTPIHHILNVFIMKYDEFKKQTYVRSVYMELLNRGHDKQSKGPYEYIDLHDLCQAILDIYGEIKNSKFYTSFKTTVINYCWLLTCTNFNNIHTTVWPVFELILNKDRLNYIQRIYNRALYYHYLRLNDKEFKHQNNVFEKVFELGVYNKIKLPTR